MNGGMSDGEIVTARSFEQLVEEIASLPPDEKAELVSKILGERPGVSVVFGNGGNHVNRADLVVQINSADKELIEGITSAIARRIER